MRLSRKLLVVVAFLVFGPRLVFFVWKVAKEQPLPQGQVDANSQNRIRQWAEAMWQRVSHGSRAGPPNPLGMNNTSPHTGSRGGRSHRGKSRAKVAAHGSPTAPASLRVLDYVRCNVSACGGTFAHQRQFVVFNATLQSATLRRWVRAPVRTSPIEASIWDQHGIGAIPNANQPAVTGATPASTGDTPNDGSSSIADQLYPVANIRVASAPREAAGGVGNVTAGSGEHIPQGQGPAVGPTRWRYFHFPKPLFDLLPIDEPRWHPRSCAVVGNSGAILLQTAGLEIDTHDVVIRLNLAPVYGFQPYVGQKTTFDFVNANNVRQLLQVRRCDLRGVGFGARSVGCLPNTSTVAWCGVVACGVVACGVVICGVVAWGSCGKHLLGGTQVLGCLDPLQQLLVSACDSYRGVPKKFQRNTGRFNEG
eukprot:jgi/Mesvir1/10874/Mv14214-RA.1